LAMTGEGVADKIEDREAWHDAREKVLIEKKFTR
jgi:hypothetical protein